jgi:hypothetical protein
MPAGQRAASLVPPTGQRVELLAPPRPDTFGGLPSHNSGAPARRLTNDRASTTRTDGEPFEDTATHAFPRFRRVARQPAAAPGHAVRDVRAGSCWPAASRTGSSSACPTRGPRAPRAQPDGVITRRQPAERRRAAPHRREPRQQLRQLRAARHGARRAARRRRGGASGPAQRRHPRAGAEGAEALITSPSCSPACCRTRRPRPAT